jgi:hypothetical protein
MCSFDQEELSRESAHEEEADAEVDCCSAEAICSDANTRDGDGCDEEGDRDNVTGVYQKAYPRDIPDSLPADISDSAPWCDVRSLHGVDLLGVNLQNK